MGIDVGTTTIRSFIFNRKGKTCFKSARVEIRAIASFC